MCSIIVQNISSFSNDNSKDCSSQFRKMLCYALVKTIKKSFQLNSNISPKKFSSVPIHSYVSTQVRGLKIHFETHK